MTIYVHSHPDTAISDWQNFVGHLPPHLAEVVERRRATLPEIFFPLARGLAIASDELLHRAGYTPGAYPPHGWQPGPVDDSQKSAPSFCKLSANVGLVIEQWGDLWVIARQHKGTTELQFLIFAFGSTPIATRRRESAMHLAEFCNLVPGIGLGWARPITDGTSAAIIRAKERRVIESVASDAPRAARVKQYLDTLSPSQRVRFYRRLGKDDAACRWDNLYTPSAA